MEPSCKSRSTKSRAWPTRKRRAMTKKSMWSTRSIPLVAVVAVVPVAVTVVAVEAPLVVVAVVDSETTK